jgi:hypothetical protein
LAMCASMLCIWGTLLVACTIMPSCILWTAEQDSFIDNSTQLSNGGSEVEQIKGIKWTLIIYLWASGLEFSPRDRQNSEQIWSIWCQDWGPTYLTDQNMIRYSIRTNSKRQLFFFIWMLMCYEKIRTCGLKMVSAWPQGF